MIPLGGIVSDRTNRHQILLVAQILGMFRSLVLAWLALSGTINVWQIAFLGVLLGTINAFDIPTRQAFLPETVQEFVFLLIALVTPSPPTFSLRPALIKRLT